MMYDALVIGLGGVGAAALSCLARRGVRALGLEQHALVHDRGSSHGHSRVIRKAYFEHPDYVPLLEVAYREWAALERRVERELYLETGVLQVGPPDGEVMTGVLSAAAAHGLEVESLEPSEVRARFGFKVSPGSAGVFERRAGVLRVEACVRAHLDVARAYGAELREGVAVSRLTRAGGGWDVSTSTGERLRAARVLVCVGAWTPAFVPELKASLRVLGKTMFWRAPAPELTRAAGCPAFLFEHSSGVYYGLPAFDGEGVKLAQHSGGETLPDADVRSRPVPMDERRAVDAFAARSLPDGLGEHLRSSRCMYTSTPDGHFLLDQHPLLPRVTIVAGLSGHGFKLLPALGEAAADLLMEGGSGLPVEFLGFRDACPAPRSPPR